MKRMHKLLKSIGPSLFIKYSSTGSNLAKLYQSLPSCDQKTYEVYVKKSLDAESYASEMYKGHLRYLLKNHPTNYEEARVRLYW